MSSIKHFLSGSIAFLLVACVRKIEVSPPKGSELFPVTIGLYRIYEVWDTTFTTTDTIFKHYFVYEKLTGTEKDINGRTLYRLERYESPTYPGNFTFRELWTLYKSTTHAERREGNTRYVVLEFPVELNKSWDGNRFNDFDPEFYRYVNVDTTVTIQQNTFQNCVMVLQRHVEGSILQEIHTYELYAPEVGMIKRYDRMLLWDYDGNNRILSTDSYMTRIELVDYGVVP